MKKVHRWAVPLVGVVLLSGCTPSGGTAAVVNGVSIPDSLVTEYAEGCSAALAAEPQATSQSANDLRAGMVSWAVVGEMAKQEAIRTGNDFSDETLTSYIDSAGRSYLMSDSRCSQALLDVARHDLLVQSMGTADVSEYLESQDIVLNPRYGTWDWNQLGPSGSGSLSEVAS
ncbi:hypothetical protein GCM10009785_15730 [Brooklawnia cerclae]|uniref:Lipoprotein YajG n=1 Tax=Brooklawnia cerclae TaxID=349934 RepID=A0ABX0SHH6_9ACTN|nr:hypothetical protein [Brooklawnia cerclae]NIH57857.1 putative lipoprotein YajG [Brooklawnia cerclae]